MNTADLRSNPLRLRDKNQIKKLLLLKTPRKKDKIPTLSYRSTTQKMKSLNWQKM